MKFGHLTAIEAVRVEKGRKVYRFECDCGAGVTVIRRIDLVRSLVARGSVPSCPSCSTIKPRKSRFCLQCEGLPHRRPKHGFCACGERFEEEQIDPIWVIAQHRRTA